MAGLSLVVIPGLALLATLGNQLLTEGMVKGFSRQEGFDLDPHPTLHLVNNIGRNFLGPAHFTEEGDQALGLLDFDPDRHAWLDHNGRPDKEPAVIDVVCETELLNPFDTEIHGDALAMTFLVPVFRHTPPLHTTDQIEANLARRSLRIFACRTSSPASQVKASLPSVDWATSAAF